MVLYIDPFKIEKENHDADIIFVTHEHFDHFSVEDILKVIKKDTVLIVPESMKANAKKSKLPFEELVMVVPGERKQIRGISFETVAAYNKLKPFHPKMKKWVGYIIELSGSRIYIAGDTDLTEECQKVRCDVAMVPIGGTYTMDAAGAAKLVNIIKPKTAIPTHYGSVAGDRAAEEVFRANVDKDISVEIKMQRY